LKEKRIKIRNTLIIIAIVAVVLAAVVYTFITHGSVKTDTTELGFKEIGELATQEVRAREVQSYEGDPKKIFGVDLPFTQSHYIYSYVVDIKAGFDFTKVDADVDQENRKITISLPDPYIISAQVDNDSFETYEEKNNIFNPFTPEKSNDLSATLKEQAVEDAIANGLYEKATENGKAVIKGMVRQMYDIDSGDKDAYVLEFTTENNSETKSVSSSSAS
jgi:hypothetical protein